MFALFRSLTERVKALFISTAALDFEADFIARQAERKADLLRRAAEYEREGLHPVAKELRQQAEALSIQRPLASILPSVEHLQADRQGTLFLPYDADGIVIQPDDHRPSPRPKKKGAQR